MSGWIKFWKDMPNDPRVLSAAMKLSEKYLLAHRSPGGGSDLSNTEICNAWRNAVTGALATLWCYADEHIRDDDSLPLTSQTLDAIVGLEGFFDAMPREWIDELDDGSIVLPGYCEKNSLIAKRKRTIKSNARVTQWRRAKKSKCNGVTQRHVTQHIVAGDLDQDSDQDNKKNPPTPKGGVSVDKALQEQIIATYHELLPDLPAVRDWPERRSRKLAARIAERVKAGKPADKPEYWRALFTNVQASDFLCGRKHGTDWRCPGLEWLLEPKNFTKVIEGAYRNNEGMNGVGHAR